MYDSYDVIIVGGGIVGLTLACALASQTSLSIAILESGKSESWNANDFHHRVSAYSLSSQRIFNALGIWQTLQKKRISPFAQIQVWESGSNTLLNFASQDIAEMNLGYIIENNLVQSVLVESVKQYPQVDYLTEINLTQLSQKPNEIELVSEQQIFRARLVIGADGAHSWLRNQAGMDIQYGSYHQHAIVATVHSENAHNQIARQIFLETGPLAFLPLSDTHACSIVWSLPSALCNELLALDSSVFMQQLSQKFENRLGEILQISNRFSFPLFWQQANSYIKNKIALVGDAAHTVHPLAGQGVNIGLLDAASLAEIISAAYAKQRDFASLATLRQYERWRKADNMHMLFGIDALKKLFASEQQMIVHIRQMGLQMTNHLPLIKNVFMRHAVGERTDLPQLARQN